MFYNLGVDKQQADEMMFRMNESFGPYGIQFNYKIYEHNDGTYYCIPGYSGINQNWLDAIDNMKKQYAVGVGSTLNIFVSCQTPSLQGTLFGIGTFPWDNAALRNTGGLWLNGIAVNRTAQLVIILLAFFCLLLIHLLFFRMAILLLNMKLVIVWDCGILSMVLMRF